MNRLHAKAHVAAEALRRDLQPLYRGGGDGGKLML